MQLSGELLLKVLVGAAGLLGVLSCGVGSDHDDAPKAPSSHQAGLQLPSADLFRAEVKNCERAYEPSLCKKVLPYFDSMLESGQGTDRQRASAHAARARILSNSFGQHHKAILDYSKAIGLNPTSPEFYFNRGNAHLRLKENRLAIADYDMAIHLDPGSLDSYGSRGWAYHLMGRDDVAIKDFNHILQGRPDDLRALLNRSAAYESLNNRQGAVNDLKAAYRIQPGNPYVISRLRELGEEAWLKLQ